MHSRLPGARKPAVEEPPAAGEEGADVLSQGSPYQALSTWMARPLAGAGAARRWYLERSWLPGWMFAAVTQAPALLAVAWLLPGFAMLLAGRLQPAPLLIIFVPLAIALCYFAMRQLPVSWPRFGSGGSGGDAPSAGAASDAGPASDAGQVPGAGLAAGPARGRAEVPGWAVVLTVAIAAGFAVFQALERSQQLIVARDPGEYLQYAYWIAHHGTARIQLSPVDFGGLGAGSASGVSGLQFASPGFLANGTVLTPAFMAGLPLVLVGGIWAHGVSGGLLMAPFIGGCAVLSFAGLAGRLVGVRWSPAAALVLAVALPQQYVSRTTLSEPLVQVLLFGGLCLMIDSLVVNSRTSGPWRTSGAATTSVAPPVPDTAGVLGASGAFWAWGRGRLPWQAMTLAGFGGVALGLTILVNIGSLSILLPAFPLLAIMFVARLPQAGPLTGGLLAGAGCGVLEGAVLARPYLTTLSSQLHDIDLAAAGFGVATALIAPLAFPGFRAWVKRVVNWGLPVMGLNGQTRRVPLLATLLEGLAVVLPVAALIGFAIRPSVQVTRGATDPYVIRIVAGLQRLAGLPVNGRQQYYEQSLNWVIWYLGLPAVLLACIGAALLGRRCVRALLRWRGAPHAVRTWALPLAIFSWSVVVTLWDPATLPDQPWASRRLVPVVLPGLICLALWVCSRIRMRASDLGAGPVASVLVTACSVLALALPAAVTTFDPGYVRATAASGGSGASGGSTASGNSVAAGGSTSAAVSKHLAIRGMALRRTYTGEQAAVSGLCSAIGPGASVIIVDSATASSFTQVVRGMCGVPTARMDGAPAVAIEQVISAIERVGLRPVLLGNTSTSVALIGAVPHQGLSLHTTQDAHALTGPPAAPWQLTYTVWMSSPAGT